MCLSYNPNSYSGLALMLFFSNKYLSSGLTSVRLGGGEQTCPLLILTLCEPSFVVLLTHLELKVNISLRVHFIHIASERRGPDFAFVQ